MKDFPFFKLVPKSDNVKTGKMAVSTSWRGSCPKCCAFRGNGCYAEHGPIKMVWDACGRSSNDLDADWQAFMEQIRALPAGTVFRHNQAGDLIGDMILNGKSNRIHWPTALRLAEECAIAKVRGYTYTHYPVIHQDGSFENVAVNRLVVQEMNRMGFVVNISANSPAHADAILDSGLNVPVCCNLPGDVMKSGKPTIRSPGGRTIVICPAMRKKEMTCRKCMACMSATRKPIIGFPAHGTCRKRAEAVIAKWDERCKRAF